MPGLSPDQWQALSPQLEKALDMSDEQRLHWLSSLRNEDPSLAEQLEELLGAHRALASEGFLEDHAVELPEQNGLTGQSVGSYTLMSEIGRGGMGTVWLAERNDGRFERKVAVKFLNIALLGKSGEERFRREGMILGRLAHPHIAELIDAGVSQTSQPYLVLEYVQGDHIDRYCDRLGLDITARIRLFLDVLAAVEHAHLNSIVHRDLKPSNVLVRNDGQAKLLDFGIAKLLEIDENTPETQLTIDGSRALTPEFAAPEQLTGQPVTTATDVYALGVLLYVLLTGQHPAGTETRAPADFIKAVLDTEPTRPSQMVSRRAGHEQVADFHAARRASTPERLKRMLRGDLDTIVANAVKKDPGKRYASVRAFADDLRRYLNHEPISARPDSITYRARRYVRRHRTRVVASSLVALILIAASVTTWVLSHRSAPLPHIKQRRLTANPPDLPVMNAVVSPDGAYLGYADRRGIHLQSVATSAPFPVSLPAELQDENAERVFGGWDPDSKRFLASAASPGQPASLWSISINGDAPTKIAEIDRLFGPAFVSPDGTAIAYTRVHRTWGAHEIWLMRRNGESPHLVKAGDSQSNFSDIGWSPDGKRLVYLNVGRLAGHRDISIRSCDLEGQNETTIVREPRLRAFAWTTLHRFVYARAVDPGGTESDNLLEVRVDQNGVPQATPRPLTDWSGFAAFYFSATADGKHLAFLRGSAHVDFFVGNLSENTERLVSFGPLKIDDNYNIPLAWSPDSREIIFSSKRADTRLVYRQRIDGKSPAQLLTDADGMNFYLARVTPDRSAVLVEGAPSGNARRFAMYRQEWLGGAPRLLFELPDFVDYSCATKVVNLCVYGIFDPGTRELVLSGFDPKLGDRKELLRIPIQPDTSARLGEDYWWELAPNGSLIAMVKRRGDSIRLIPLNGAPARTISFPTGTDLLQLSWTADSEGLLVTRTAPRGLAVFRMDLNGTAHPPLWEQRQALWAGAIQSPDGRRVITWAENLEANAWMIDDF